MSKKLYYLLILFTLSLAVPPQLQAQETYYVDLYTDVNSGGTKYRVPIYQNEKDLNLIQLNDGTHLNDRISSVEYKLPQDWQVTLWQHPHYQGRSYVLHGEGKISNLGQIDSNFNFNDKVSSVQWVSARSDTAASLGTKKCSLQLFEDANNQGRRLSVPCQQNIGDLRYVNSDDGRKGFDNKVSSLNYNLPDGVKVELYQHNQYRPPLLIVLQGSGKVSVLEELKNDRISSINWVRN